LGVPGTKLLEDGFQHLGLLLDHLTELLELGIMPEKVQISQVRAAFLSNSGSGGGSSCGSC